MGLRSLPAFSQSLLSTFSSSLLIVIIQEATQLCVCTGFCRAAPLLALRERVLQPVIPGSTCTVRCFVTSLEGTMVLDTEMQKQRSHLSSPGETRCCGGLCAVSSLIQRWWHVITALNNCWWALISHVFCPIRDLVYGVSVVSVEWFIFAKHGGNTK